MKRVLLAFSALTALTVGSIATASAQEIHVGPGGVFFGPHRHYYDYGNCRTVITHRTNEWGNDVTIRRRICD